MNCRILSFLLPVFMLAVACNNRSSTKSTDDATWTAPPAGTVVAVDSMKIEDPLNNFYFAVKLTSSPANDMPGTMGFVYDMDMHAGPNKGLQQLTMPKGGKDLKPLIRRAKDGSTMFIIGFIPGKDFGGDTTFQEYYSVKAEGKNISVHVLKSYSFQ